MRQRFAAAALLLYPRRVRRAHGPDMVVLIDDLVGNDGRSRTWLLVGLAIDGLGQRILSTATGWTVVGVLALTSCGGLVLSDFAAAYALHHVHHVHHPHRPAHAIPPARLPHHHGRPASSSPHICSVSSRRPSPAGRARARPPRSRA